MGITFPYCRLPVLLWSSFSTQTLMLSLGVLSMGVRMRVMIFFIFTPVVISSAI